MRNIWTGAITLGLVQIPVGLRSATVEYELQLHMLDKRDFSPIHNRRLNKSTERPVEWGDLVKKYEVERGKYVGLMDDEILQFVEHSEIDPIYWPAATFSGLSRFTETRSARTRDGRRKTSPL